MNKIYLVNHCFDVDGGFGDAIPQEEVICGFDNREDAFGRRKNEKIPGTRNDYHIVKQDKYMLNDGIHEAIVSEELWNHGA